MAMKSREEVDHGNQSADTLFTVKKLLHLPLLKDARLLAGAGGIEGAVTGVIVLESASALNRINPGDFVMFSGHSGPNEQEALAALVAELAERGAVALGIQANRDRKYLAGSVLMEAETQRLPLLELPVDSLFQDIMTKVLDRVITQESSQLAILQKRVLELTRILLDGNGLYPFLDAMEQLLGHPVAIICIKGRHWLSQSFRNTESHELRALIQSMDTHLKQVTKNGMVRIKNKQPIYVNAIAAPNRKQTFLVLVENKHKILPIDTLCVDRLSPIAGMELATAEAVNEVESRYLDPFIKDWLLGKINHSADWRVRAEVCGYSLPEDSQLYIIVIDCTPLDRRENLEEYIRIIRAEYSANERGILTAVVDEELAIIMPVSSNSHEEQDIRQLVMELSKSLRILLDHDELKLYVGRASDPLEGAAMGWAQAKRAKHVAQVCGMNKNVVIYEELGVYSLLYMIPASDEREQFLCRFMSPLQKADRKGGGRLLETLEMFFLCNGNIKLTSEKLSAHYNTIVYRLDKVQTILGMSLDNPEDRLQLQLALKLVQITPGLLQQHTLEV